MWRRNYLLDENLSPVYRQALNQRNSDIVVWRIGDAGTPPRGTPDPDILIWCEQQTFSLVTNNRASMPHHLQNHLLAGHHIPGIFVLNPKMRFGETIEELELIWYASSLEEYADLINYLPVSYNLS